MAASFGSGRAGLFPSINWFGYYLPQIWAIVLAVSSIASNRSVLATSTTPQISPDTVSATGETSPGWAAWHSRFPYSDLTCVGYVGQALLAFSYFGTGMRLTDDGGWTAIATGQTNAVRGLVRGHDLTVALGDAGTILTSTDTLTWIPRSAGVSGRLFSGVYLNGTFTVVGDGGAILTSTNGSNWSQQPSPTTDSLRGIVTDGNQLVVLSREGRFMRSLDTANWSSHESPSPGPLYGLAYGAGQYVAVGTNGTIITSTDGANWTLRRTGGPILWGVTYADEQFVAVGNRSSGRAIILTSKDGLDWEHESAPTFSDLLCVSGSADTLVAAGISGTFVRRQGGFWSRFAVPAARDLNGAAYGNGTFVLTGWDHVYASVNGVDWEAHPTGFRLAEQENGITFGDGKFMLLAGGGQVATSTDARTWKVTTLSLAADLSGVEFLQGRFFAYGRAGFLASSLDTVNWEMHPAPSPDGIRGLAHGNGRYLVITSSGTILFSDDGQSWERSRSFAASSITFGNGCFVLEGFVESWVTFDGESFWLGQRPRNSTASINFVGGMFLAVGGRTVLTSLDGFNWTSRLAPIGSLRTAAFGVNTFLISGDLGVLYQSDPLPEQPLTIVNQPRSLVTQQHSMARLVVGATATEPIQYQWQHNGVPLPGQTNSWLKINASELSAAGDYSVIVSSTKSIVTSDPAQVSIEPANSPLNHWQLCHSAAELEPITKFAFGAGRYVGIGPEGILRLSEDGLHWDELAFTADSFVNVRWVNDAFIATGEHGTIATSPDGFSWQLGNVGRDVTVMEAGWGNGMFVLVGSNGSIFTSNNQRGWAEQDSGTAEHLNSLTYDSGMFMAVGNKGTILISDDGSTWEREFIDTTEDLLDVAGGQFFVVIGSNRAVFLRDNGAWRVMTQKDQETGSKDLSFILPFSPGYIYGGAGSVFRGQFTAGGGLQFGITTLSTLGLKDATFVNENPVGIGTGGALLTLPQTEPFDIPGALHLLGVASDGNVCAAVGRTGTILTRWRNGPWTVRNSGVTNDLFSIAQSNGRFIAVGSAGVLLTSTNAIDWQRADSGLTRNLHSIVASPGLWLAVGEGSTILTSTDGFAWSKAVPVSADNSLKWIAHGNGKFLALGTSGSWQSDDGVNWSLGRWGLFPGRRIAVAFGVGKFVALAQNFDEAQILVSSDAQTWEAIPTNLPVSVTGVRFLHGQFFVFGRDGTIYTSRDGILWVKRPSTTAWTLRDVTEFSNSIVAVGDYGHIVESEPLIDTGAIIVQQPPSELHGALGTTLFLEVRAHGSAPLSYHWRFNGTPITGATNAMLAVHLNDSSAAGKYDVVVTNPLGSEISMESDVRVRNDPSAPAVLNIRMSDDTITFNVAGSSTDLWRIEFTDTLAKSDWHSVGVVAGNSTFGAVVHEIGQQTNARFYRAIKVSQR